MLDSRIVELYWQRDEEAISQTDMKYGRLCRGISNNILRDLSDSEECVNDTYLRAWNSMPTERPERLPAFLGKIVRNLSISRLRHRTADKRGGGEYALCLEELRDCAGGAQEPEKELELTELTEHIDKFLAGLKEQERDIFVSRYWYMAPVDEIAERAGFSYSKTASLLHRTRKKLELYLGREGLI